MTEIEVLEQRVLEITRTCKKLTGSCAELALLNVDTTKILHELNDENLIIKLRLDILERK